MADVVGTISACLAIAQFIAHQIRKWIDAPASLNAICQDSTSMQTYLAELRDAVEIDPRAALTAPRLSGRAVKSAHEAVGNCWKYLDKIEVILQKILGEELIESDSRFKHSLVRAHFRRFESDLNSLQSSLKDCRLDIVLISNLMLLRLSRQPAQMHDLDRRQIDNINLMVGLVLEKVSGHPFPAATQLKNPMPPSRVANTTAQPSGGRVKSTSGQNDAASKLVIRRDIAIVKRTDLSTRVLDEDGWKWLNDPFDMSSIHVYGISDEELSRLTERQPQGSSSIRRPGEEDEEYSTKKPYTSGSSVPEVHSAGRGKVEPVSLDEYERDKKLKEQEMQMKDKTRTKKEKQTQEKIQMEETRMKKEKQKEQEQQKSPLPPSPSRQVFSSDQELIDALLDSWELPPYDSDNEAAIPEYEEYDSRQGAQGASRLSSSSDETKLDTPCGHRFKIGETMYQCYRCSPNGQVFCKECYTSSSHDDHPFTYFEASDTKSVCDCDPKTQLQYDVFCHKHRVKMLGSSRSTPYVFRSSDMGREE